MNPYLLWMPPGAGGRAGIRPREARDVQAIRDLMARAYPPPHGPEAVWREATLLRHLEVFPEGQWVALAADGRVVGSSTSMRVGQARAFAPHTWQEITGHGLLGPHDPGGEVLYGVNIVVDPDFQGQGIGRELYQARIALALQLGCRWMVAGARIPGYHLHAEAMSPEAYVDAVAAGTLHDPTLSKQLRVGFRVHRVLHDYAPDPETLGNAALIWMELDPPHAI